MTNDKPLGAPDLSSDKKTILPVPPKDLKKKLNWKGFFIGIIIVIIIEFIAISMLNNPDPEIPIPQQPDPTPTKSQLSPTSNSHD